MLGSDPRRTPASVLALHAAELSDATALVGGVRSLVQGLERAALRAGCGFTYGVDGISVREGHGVQTRKRMYPARCVVIAKDGAVAGAQLDFKSPSNPSLSAVVWSFVGSVHGRAVARETVLPSFAQEEELLDLFEHVRIPREPTITLLSLDGHDESHTPTTGVRRFVLHVPAPAAPDRISDEDVEALQVRVFKRLSESGFLLRMGSVVRSDPRDFAMEHTATGGALYGHASHGVLSPLRRKSIRVTQAEHAWPKVYYANKWTHPGPLLSMQLTSGRLAAQAVLLELHVQS
jgi:1-hydroxycarotenoid 3,4-desaturase